VKELAAEIGEPQTKLYRHMKQLEAPAASQRVAAKLKGSAAQSAQPLIDFFEADHALADRVAQPFESMTWLAAPQVVTAPYGGQRGS
jgi:hypothetical protein